MPTLHQLLLEKPKSCPCGRTHQMNTRRAAVVENAPAALREALEGHCSGRMLLVCDETTHEILGKAAQQELSALGPVDVTLLPGAHPHAEEASIGGVLMDIKPGTTRLIAVGSGTVNDTTRYVASRTGLAYDVLGTAPSMDGYTSSVSPMLRRGFKVTVEAVAPENAFLDIDALCAAPRPMVAAGFGDILGKYTALCDWSLGRILLDEYYCEDTVGLMRSAVDVCISQAEGLARMDRTCLSNLGEALLLAGIAMQRVGNSRPASGAEHHLSHYWEMQQLQRGQTPTLHGDKVGVATLLVMTYYRKLFEKLPAFGALPAKDAYPYDIPAETLRMRVREHWAELGAMAGELSQGQAMLSSMLRSMGGPVHPSELGIDAQDVRDALRNAMHVRERFSVLRLGAALGVHEAIVEQVMEEVYG